MVGIDEDTNVLIGKVALKRLDFKKCLEIEVDLIICMVLSAMFYNLSLRKAKLGV
jgi:hypothetical protein